MTESELQEAARRLVDREVIYCVSSLVYGMTQAIGELSRDAQESIGFNDDDAANLWRREPDADDFSDAVPIGYTVTVEENEDGWRYTVTYDGEEPETAGGFDDEIEAWREAFEEMREDQPDGAEIYEHWIVSDWLAGKLESHGETVARDVLGGLTIWARPTTGQAIAMDGVIRRIAAELNE